MPNTLVQFSTELADAVERAGSYVITVLEGGREGVSGTIWRDGIAITAEHTIRGLDEVTVLLPSGSKLKARVAGRDPGTDVAILEVPGIRPVAIADESQSRVGDIVLAVGRRPDEGVSATCGTISAISGPWRTWQGARVDRWLRLDLNPFTGFSGGPIVNARGEAIGMATSGPRRSAVTIPAATVNRVIDQLVQRGRIARGYLGVGMQPVAFPEGTRQSLALPADRGLLVVALAQGSPAEKDGMMLGDIIVAAEGTPTPAVQSLQPFLDSEYVGKAIAFDVVRGGQLVKLSITLGEKPRN
ncbi:MAG TPA: trypsin-like peptidase domain-containing protein [Terracidiphilus sp.]|jgi:S1-C subfamily serine protease